MPALFNSVDRSIVCGFFTAFAKVRLSPGSFLSRSPNLDTPPYTANQCSPLATMLVSPHSAIAKWKDGSFPMLRRPNLWHGAMALQGAASFS